MHTNSLNILILVKEGNNLAFKQFYELYASRIFDVSLRILKDQKLAEEVVQETFISIFNHRADIDVDRNPWPLLYVTAKRLCLNQLRNSKTAQLYLNQLQIEDVDVVHQQLQAKELQEAILRKIASLPAQQRRAMELSRFNGLSHQEIADQMGISIHTVKNHIAQGLSQLRKYLLASDYLISILLLLFFAFN